MQSASFSKFKKLLGIVALAAVLVISNIFTYTAASNTKNSDPGGAPPGYYVNFHTDFHPKLNFERFAPFVMGLEDAELQGKINMNLRALFIDWMPEKLQYSELIGLNVPYSSDKYLSLRIAYAFFGRRTDYVQICNTIDMSTGEVLYLDDILEVDEELVSMILTEGTIKMDFDDYSGEHDVYYPQKYLDMERPEHVLERLRLCSVPFSEDEWSYKPTFHLEKNRLYLLSVFNEYSTFYIEPEKISHKLKVDAW